MVTVSAQINLQTTYIHIYECTKNKNPLKFSFIYLGNNKIYCTVRHSA
jgi:hypothetical protein